MPAIPIYSASPIVAAKPEGITPQTAQAGQVPTPKQDSVRSTPASAYQPYPAAQPEARPSLPAPTGAAQPSTSHYYAPTPTQRFADVGPPAPQPGAAPTASGGSHLLPPPKAGETLQSPPPAQITQAPMPPQMSYAPPMGSVLGPARASTTTSTQMLGSGPSILPPDDRFSHPPGYQQNINASEFDSHQRAAHNAFVADNPNKRLSFTGDGDDEGVWDTAKKWASAAGDSLAAAENEVWRRINKDK